jgi:hypothetical protein
MIDRRKFIQYTAMTGAALMLPLKAKAKALPQFKSGDIAVVRQSNKGQPTNLNGAVVKIENVRQIDVYGAPVVYARSYGPQKPGIPLIDISHPLFLDELEPFKGV